ncbi:hypothetical protein WJX81_005755 [Elliptochloris bilobata]|uniref:Uncharacterized protein n=1 Tax=Elliptochloris bilobata TaxID=381761 RepID=A0AAW1RDN4_9CHLO
MLVPCRTVNLVVMLGNSAKGRSPEGQEEHEMALASQKDIRCCEQPGRDWEVRTESAAILEELRVACWSEVVDMNALACALIERHPHDAQVRKVARLSREHLQPLIGRLQRPVGPVTRDELAWLRRARRVLPHFAAEFRATVHQLHSQAAVAAAA